MAGISVWLYLSIVVFVGIVGAFLLAAAALRREWDPERNEWFKTEPLSDDVEEHPEV